MCPKLFRRLSSYFPDGRAGLGQFDACIRDDRLQFSMSCAAFAVRSDQLDPEEVAMKTAIIELLGDDEDGIASTRDELGS